MRFPRLFALSGLLACLAAPAMALDEVERLETGEADQEGVSLYGQSSPDDTPLTEWRRHPLNLNTADKKTLRRLPGMDEPLLREILMRRPFSNWEEVESLPAVSSAATNAFHPYVRVGAPGIRPAFAGDVSFRARAVRPPGASVQNADPAFQHNTHLYQRTRVRYERKVQAGWLVKRGVPGPALSLGELTRYGVVKYAAQLREYGPATNLTVGNYALNAGQGLVFYDGLGEFVRPVKVKTTGASLDYTSGANSYLRGAALETRWGPLDAWVFASSKKLDVEIATDTGRVTQDLNDLREDASEPQDAVDALAQNTLTETLAGGRLAWRFPSKSMVGVTAYQGRYDRVVDPDRTTFAYGHVFRGDRATLVSSDFDFFLQRLNIFGEAARSYSSGPGLPSRQAEAWTVTPLIVARPFNFWLSLFAYDPFFFTRHGKGISFEVVGAPEELTTNQKGAQAGIDYRGRRLKGRVNYTLATFPEPLNTGSGNSTGALQASQGRKVYGEGTWSATSQLDVSASGQSTAQDTFQSLTVGAPKQQAERQADKFRGQLTWRPDRRLRFITRYEEKSQRLRGGPGARGHLLMGDVTFKPWAGTMFNARMYVFESPNADLTTGVEEIWNNVVYARLAGGMQDLRGAPGTRFYLIVKQSLGRSLDFWFKFDQTNRQIRYGPPTASRHGLHAQLDYRWGM